MKDQDKFDVMHRHLNDGLNEHEFLVCQRCVRNFFVSNGWEIWTPGFDTLETAEAYSGNAFLVMNKVEDHNPYFLIENDQKGHMQCFCKKSEVIVKISEGWQVLGGPYNSIQEGQPDMMKAIHLRIARQSIRSDNPIQFILSCDPNQDRHDEEECDEPHMEMKYSDVLHKLCAFGIDEDLACDLAEHLFEESDFPDDFPDDGEEEYERNFADPCDCGCHGLGELGPRNDCCSCKPNNLPERDMYDAVYQANGQLVKLLGNGIPNDQAINAVEAIGDESEYVHALCLTLRDVSEGDELAHIQIATLAIQEFLYHLSRLTK